MILEEDVSELCKELGHDGSEILWPGFPEPKCRKCFNINEMVDISRRRGFWVMPIDAFPLSVPQPGSQRHEIWPESFCDFRIKNALSMYNGVLLGEINERRHAICWYEQVAYCPSRGIISLDDKFEIETLWAMCRMGGSIDK